MKLNKKDCAVMDSFEQKPDELIFWAFRYFMGRSSIQASAFAQDMAKAWPHLSERVRIMVQDELEKAFKQDDKDAMKRLHPALRQLGFIRDSWEKVRLRYRGEPGYICHRCAKRLGGKWPKGHCATMFTSICPECLKERGLCSVGDYNWPKASKPPKESAGRD